MSATLSIDKVCGVGWFQWYDIKSFYEYPECHALIYKISDDLFCSGALDFSVSACGDTSSASFKQLQQNTLDFYQDLKDDTENNIIVKSKEPKYWNKFREIHWPRKRESLVSQNILNNEKGFPFNIVAENNLLRKQIDNLISDNKELKENQQDLQLFIEGLQSLLKQDEFINNTASGNLRVEQELLVNA